MEAQADFKELLALLNKHAVDYIIVGAYALAFHGAPRFTGDIDIYVCPRQQNATRILHALNEFGFGSTGLKEEDFSTPHKVVQLGVPPFRVDIITSLTGVTWEEAAATRVPGDYGDIPVFFIGREEFIANKRAMGRMKDLADIEALGEE
jgi:hypothetical protein